MTILYSYLYVKYGKVEDNCREVNGWFPEVTRSMGGDKDRSTTTPQIHAIPPAFSHVPGIDHG